VAVAELDEKAGVRVARVVAPAHGERAAALRCLASLALGAGKHAVLARAALAQGERVLLAALTDCRLVVAQENLAVR